MSRKPKEKDLVVQICSSSFGSSKVTVNWATVSRIEVWFLCFFSRESISIENKKNEEELSANGGEVALRLKCRNE